jgi:hypothetical protein
MNHEKHVIHKEVSTYTDLLPKYLEGKIKVSISAVYA